MSNALYTETDAVVSRLKKVVDILFDTDQEELADEVLAACREIKSKTLMGGLPPATILFNLTSLLQAQKIKYALIGGLAVNVHGQQRSTEDIDVLVSALPSNTGDADYMRTFGFYRGVSKTGTVLTLDSRGAPGYVELLVADNALFRWALRTAGNVAVLGSTVPMISREALVGMKLRAFLSNPKRREKDIPDIVSVLVRGGIDAKKLMKQLTPEEQAELIAISRLTAERK